MEGSYTGPIDYKIENFMVDNLLDLKDSSYPEVSIKSEAGNWFEWSNQLYQ